MKVRRGESPGLLAHKSRDTVVGARAGRRARCAGPWEGTQGHRGVDVDGTRPSTGTGRGGARGRVVGEEEAKREA